MAEKNRIMELITDDRVMDAVMRASARRAIREHLAVGKPLVSWEDGKVVWIDPHQLIAEKPWLLDEDWPDEA